jgi:hypothetical protein
MHETSGELVPLSVSSPHQLQSYVSLDDVYDEDDGEEEDENHFLELIQPGHHDLDFITAGDKMKTKRGRKIKYLNSICLECEGNGTSSKGGIWCYETQAHKSKKRAPKYIICKDCKKMVSGPKFTRHFSKCHKRSGNSSSTPATSITSGPVNSNQPLNQTESGEDANMYYNHQDEVNEGNQNISTEQVTYFYTVQQPIETSAPSSTESQHNDAPSSQMQYQFNPQFVTHQNQHKRFTKILPHNVQYQYRTSSPQANQQHFQQSQPPVVAPTGFSYVIQQMPFTYETKDNQPVQFTNETNNYMQYSSPVSLISNYTHTKQKPSSNTFAHNNTGIFQQPSATSQQPQQQTQPQSQQQQHSMIQQQTVITPTTWHNYTFNSDNQMSYEKYNATLFSHTFVPQQTSGQQQQPPQTQTQQPPQQQQQQQQQQVQQVVVFHGESNTPAANVTSPLPVSSATTTTATIATGTTTQPHKKRKHSRMTNPPTNITIHEPMTDSAVPQHPVEIRDEHAAKHFLHGNNSGDSFSLRLYNETRNEYVVLLTTHHKPVSELCSSKKRKKLNQILAPALGKFGVGAEQLLSINDVRKVLKTKHSRTDRYQLYESTSSNSRSQDSPSPTLQESPIQSSEGGIFDSSHQQPQSSLGFSFANTLMSTNDVSQEEETADKTRQPSIEPSTPSGSLAPWLQSDTPNSRSGQGGSAMRELMGMSFNILGASGDGIDFNNKEEKEHEMMIQIDKLASPTVTNGGSSNDRPHDNAL